MDAPGGDYGKAEPRSLPLLSGAAPDGIVDKLNAPRPLSGFETTYRFGDDVSQELVGTEHVASVSSGPSNFQDQQGRWQPIDPTLVPYGVGYRNAAGPFTVFFPAVPTETTPITITLDEGTLSFTPTAVDAPGLLLKARDNKLTYAGALTDTNLVYTVGYDGFKEEIVLESPSAPNIVSFTVAATGLALRAEPEGAISILAGEDVVGVFPAPWVQDSAKDPITGDGTAGPVTQTLTAHSAGRYKIDIAVDGAWLSDPVRVFPVIVDPSTSTRFPGQDAFVSLASPSSNYGTSTDLKIGSHTSDGSNLHYSYVKFNFGGLMDPDRQVYDAQAMMYNYHSGSSTASVENVKRVTESWGEGTVTYNNRPSVGSTVWDSYTGCGDNYWPAHPACYPWHTWQLWDLSEDWIQGDYENHGIQFAGPAPHPQSWKRFYSSEQPDIGGTDVRPRIYITYNDPPGRATLTSPADATFVESESPTLKIQPGVNEPNNDDVYMRYQLSFTSDFANVEVDSGWLDERNQWVVPAGELKDGQTYYWRVQTSDLYTSPGEHDDPMIRNSLNILSFTVTLKKWGQDDRWAMWRQSLGNGLTMAVNQATGNLHVDYPLDALTTPVGPMNLRLTYNSLQDVDHDIVPWNLSGGLAGERSSVPVKLTEPSYGGVLIRLADGNKLHFSEVTSRTYGGVGRGAGVVRKNADSTQWHYRTATGSRYTFASDGLLLKARTATGDWSKPGFDYVYTDGRLTKIKDPLSREVTITYGAFGNYPSYIDAWDGRRWTLGMDIQKRLASVTDPAGATVRFTYDSDGLLEKIEDGEAFEGRGTPTIIDYYRPEPDKPLMVSSVRLPGASPTELTTFAYGGPWTGKTAGEVVVFDPRALSTPDETDYKAITYFNTAGLPIRIDGPKDQAGALPVTTMLWDKKGNLVCRRVPAANVIRVGCNDPNNPTVPTGSNGPDGLQTDYAYEDEEPFNIVSETGSAPADGSAARAVTNYTYDEADAWQETYAEYFPNTSLTGIPVGANLQTTFDRNWFAGSPTPLGEQNDNWSMRWTGRIDVPEQAKWEFKSETTSDDGIRLIVGSRLPLDCWAGQGDGICTSGTSAKSWYYPGKHYELTLEYVERTQNARMKLMWKKATESNWQVIPISSVFPDLNLLTKQEDPIGTTTYTYSQDDKVRHRLTSETRAGRTTSFGYDDYGRVQLLTDPRGKTTTYEYGPGNTGPCLTKKVDRTGAETRYQCNDAGDVTRVEQVVRQVNDPDTSQEIQPLQTRVSETTYDPLGRVDLVKVHIGGQVKTITDNDYDKAGRLRFTRDAALNETEYVYEHAGRVIEERLPDPNGPTDPPRPVVKHEYDLVGNETVLTDANNKKWTKAYDALNRLTSSKDPFCAVGETYYDPAKCAATTTNYDLVANKVTVTDPHGVQTVTTFDLLGREASDRLSTFQSTRYEYDLVGNVTKVTDPAEVWVQTTYNAFSQVLTEKTRSGPGGAEVTTTNAYDSGGRLESVNGPRPIQGTQDDITTYGYDDEGRLTQVILPHAAPNITRYLYDDAGELLRVKDAEGRRRTFVHDERGRQTTTIVWRNSTALTTTSHYDDLSRLTTVVLPTDAPVDEQKFEYDNLGRRTRRYGLQGQSVVDDERFTYDPAGNLTEARDAGGQRVIALGYEIAGRLQTVTAGGATTTYIYDKGRPDTRTDPAGTTTFAYNANGLLQTLTLPAAFEAPVTYGYDTAGRPTTRTVDPPGPEALVTTRTYESASGRIDIQEIRKASAPPPASPIARFDLDYDEADNVIKKTVEVTGYPASENGAWDYHYDMAGRMDWAEDPTDVRTTYGYDGAGNRTSVQVGAQPAVITTYDGAGFPDFASDGTNYVTDELGSLKETIQGSQITTYTYDAWGRLQNANTPQGTVSYVLDALDRTVSRTEAGATTTFDFVGTSEDPAKITEGGTVTTYASSPGGPVAQAVGTTVRFLIRDLHQDVVALVDSTGATSGSTAYSSWGEIRTGSGDSSRLGYQSDLTDSRTGLVDMLTRNYSPILGRFTSRDLLFGELLQPLSLNQFVYANGSPVTFYDPTGMVRTPGGGCGTCTREDRREVRRGKGQSSEVGLPPIVDFQPQPPTPVPVNLVVDFAQTFQTPIAQPRPATAIDPDLIRAIALGAHIVGATAEVAADLGQRRLAAATLAALRGAARGLPLVAGGLTLASGCFEGLEGERGGCVARALTRGGGFLAGCGFGAWIAGPFGCAAVGVIGEEAAIHVLDNFHYDPPPPAVPYVCLNRLHITAGFYVKCPPGYDNIAH